MNRGQIFWGVLLIMLGVIFLLDQMGLLEGVDVWSLFWPTLLIGWGASLLFSHLFRPGEIVEALEVPRAGVGKARIELNHGAGGLYVGDGSGPETVLEGKFASGVVADAWQEGHRMLVELQPPDRSFRFWRTRPDWHIELNPEIVYTLLLETGASESRLDLAKLQVAELDLRTGASHSRLILPEAAGHTEVTLRSGVASLEVRVPEGVAAAIRAQGALASIRIDRDRFPAQGNGRFRSPDFEEAENQVEIQVETGVGSVSIA